MDIYIHAPQGGGKTTQARKIAAQYPPDRVVYLNEPKAGYRPAPVEAAALASKLRDVSPDLVVFDGVLEGHLVAFVEAMRQLRASLRRKVVAVYTIQEVREPLRNTFKDTVSALEKLGVSTLPPDQIKSMYEGFVPDCIASETTVIKHFGFDAGGAARREPLRNTFKDTARVLQDLEDQPARPGAVSRDTGEVIAEPFLIAPIDASAYVTWLIASDHADEVRKVFGMFNISNLSEIHKDLRPELTLRLKHAVENVYAVDKLVYDFILHAGTAVEAEAAKDVMHFPAYLPTELPPRVMASARRALDNIHARVQCRFAITKLVKRGKRKLILDTLKQFNGAASASGVPFNLAPQALAALQLLENENNI